VRVAFRAVLMAGFEKPAPGPSNDRTAIEQQPGPGPMALLCLRVATGLRRGEALALRWSHVDLSNGLLRVRGTLSRVKRAPGHRSKPKTERSRRDVPLSPATVALLRSVKASQAAQGSLDLG
jgi:integrase